MTERVVVGGSIAALVAADELARQGEDVRLLLPERGVGGGFAQIRRDGRELELGVRLLELSYEGVGEQVPPLRDYRPGVGAHRDYVPLVERWLRELLGDRLVEVERPGMFFDGRIVDDLYFTTDALAVREALGEDDRAVIAAEARAALAAAGAAAGVLDPAREPELAGLSAGEASRRNHGQTFHDRLIAPIADKLVPGGTERVLATHRRKIWVPLFWPLTLAQACERGEVSFRPLRPFHTVAADGGPGLVDALVERMGARGVRVDVVGRLTGLSGHSNGGVELRFSGGGPFEAEHPIVGCGPTETFAAAGIGYEPEQARSVICWVEAKPTDLSWTPSLLNVVDPEIPALRVSSGGRGAPGAQLLTVELRHDLPDDRIEAAASSALVATGLVAEGAELRAVMSAAAPTFAVPTEPVSEQFRRARHDFDSRELRAEVVGGAAGFGADALGEQVIQGLRAAEVLLS